MSRSSPGAQGTISGVSEFTVFSVLWTRTWAAHLTRSATTSLYGRAEINPLFFMYWRIS